MKGTLLVIFHSKHGYVKRYVDIIGNALGCDAVPLKKLKSSMLCYDKYLFISSVRGGCISEFKKIAKYLDAIGDKLTVCGVGMMPRKEQSAAQLKDSSIPVEYESKIPVFYAQGGFDMSELRGGEKMGITILERRIRSGSFIDEEGTFVLNAIQTPIDEVKTANIKPLIDFFEDKHVDPKLYSPAESAGEQPK